MVDHLPEVMEHAGEEVRTEVEVIEVEVTKVEVLSQAQAGVRSAKDGASQADMTTLNALSSKQWPKQ